ncbi:hypothetical protein NDA14_004083 [Ustilago hordei]|nr:hypothetical protein NDA14_004083 [Ustilago hordei]
MHITRFSVVLLLTIGLLLLSHTAEAGGAEGGASSSKSSGSKFNFLSRFRKTSQPPPLPEDNVLNRLRHIIPEEEFRQLEGLYQEGFQKNYFDNFGESRHDLPRRSQATINDNYC